MALENKGAGLVPLVSVAALLQRGDVVLPPLDGGLFAYSPLEATGMPVHMNAWFETHEGRLAWPNRRQRGHRQLADNDEHDDKEEEEEEAALPSAQVAQKIAWNRELGVCCVEAYLDLLRAMPEMVKSDQSRMYRLWPASSGATTAFAVDIIKPLYSGLAQCQLFLLQSGQMAKLQGGVFKPRDASDTLRLLFRSPAPASCLFACVSKVEAFQGHVPNVCLLLHTIPYKQPSPFQGHVPDVCLPLFHPRRAQKGRSQRRERDLARESSEEASKGSQADRHMRRNVCGGEGGGARTLHYGCARVLPPRPLCSWAGVLQV